MVGLYLYNMKHLIENLLREELETRLFENSLNDLILICENEEESRTFEWDLTKNQLEKTMSTIHSPTQGERFLEVLLNKTKNIPSGFRKKMVKYVSISLMGLLSLNTVSSLLSANAPDIKQDILTSIETSAPVKRVSSEKENQVNKELDNRVAKPTKASQNLINHLKYEEGSIKHKGEPVLKAYKLGDGAITIGWGHAEKIRRSKFKLGQVISRETAEELFKNDLAYAEKVINDVLSRWDKKGIKYTINQDMYDAMVSMAFNMGRSGFRNSDFIQLVKRGEYEKAKEKIKTTSEKSFEKHPGLKSRREKESELFGRGVKKLNR